MPFRETFSCLWCGRSHTARDGSDIEGWAQLCPDCVGRAGENSFLRFRLKAALAERSRAPEAVASPVGDPAASAAGNTAASAAGNHVASPSAPAGAVSAGVGASRPTTRATAAAAPERPALDDEMAAYYEARAPEYDDFYLRRGRYDHGAIHNMAWNVDLDTATQWLDRQPIRGEIVELAAGTGWWSPLLAQKGELWMYDVSEEPLSLARDRLLAHGLRAHLHRRDAWAEPDRPVDFVFAGFWLSHVPQDRLADFLALVRRWLKPGGQFLFIDSRRDPFSGGDSQRPELAPGVQVRTLRDGRQFRVVKEYYEPDELVTALHDAGFTDADVETTARFFLLGRAVAG